MNTRFVKLGTDDEKLIKNMRETIMFQMNMGKRRESLVYAIVHNVQYLSKLHKDHTLEM